MKILIRQNTVVCGADSHADKYRKTLKQLEGRWLEVETEHLFSDQFNTAPDDVSESGMRIFARDVADIVDDVRVNRIKDVYTGKHYEFMSEVPDEAFEDARKKYLMRWQRHKDERISRAFLKEVPIFKKR